MIPVMSRTFASFVRDNRTERGLTQQELADRVGVDRTYITKIERGNPVLPQYELREKLGACLGFTDDDLASAGVLDMGSNMHESTDLVRVSPNLARALATLSEGISADGNPKIDFSSMEPIAKITETLGRLGPLQRDFLATAIQSISRKSWTKLLDILLSSGEITQEEFSKISAESMPADNDSDPREQLVKRVRALPRTRGVQEGLEYVVGSLERQYKPGANDPI